MDIAGTKPTVESVAGLPDESHEGVQCPDPLISHPGTFLLAAMNLIEGGVDVQRQERHLAGGDVDPAEALGSDAFQLPDMA